MAPPRPRLGLRDVAQQVATRLLAWTVVPRLRTWPLVTRKPVTETALVGRKQVHTKCQHGGSLVGLLSPGATSHPEDSRQVLWAQRGKQNHGKASPGFGWLHGVSLEPGLGVIHVSRDKESRRDRS